MPSTVTIGSDTYDIYSSVATVDTYANGSLTASAWESLVEDDKARVLIMVTRWIDAQCWQGEKVDPAQPLAWPRTIGSIETIEYAATILAVMVAADTTLPDTMTGATVAADGGTKRLKAGSVEIEYFRKFYVMGIGALAGEMPFPQNIMSMIGVWLCNSSSFNAGAAGAVAFGTCAPAVVGRRNLFGFWQPI